MARSANSTPGDSARLLDENEQLRTALESALEENTLLVEERDRLRERLRDVSRELRSSDAVVLRQRERADFIEPAFAAQNTTEEELRVAFEELQVLTEELEAANTSLHQTNRDLDARVEERTVQLREINQTLQSTQASLRAVADLVPELLWRTDGKGRADWFNQRWMQYTGYSAGSLADAGWLDTLHSRDYAVARTNWGIAVASGKPFEHEHRIRNAAGEFRWFLVRAEPLRDGMGRIVCWYAAGTDIHDRRVALDELQRSELRFRTLIEGMPQLVWRSANLGNWTWCSPQWRAYTGQDDAEALRLGWIDALHPDDRQGARDAWGRAEKNGGLEIAARIFHAAENRHRHFRTRALPVRDAAGRVIEWLGTSTDVDDIVQLQEQQNVLVGELQHRTRNLMAVVQAVTARTIRGAGSLEEFEECIKDRFAALARVQGLLSRREAGTRVAFDLLLREELSAHADLGQQIALGKIALDGPADVPLRSATVQTLALALHELATNAAKYGALSNAGGQLAVTWGVRPDQAVGPQLWVDWRETGVADMPSGESASRGGGYGRELIERALPYQLGARTHYRFETDGIHCTIEMTVPAEPNNLDKIDG